MSRPIEILTSDPDTGETEHGVCVPGDFVLICAEPCYLDGIAKYPNGTVVLTLKQHRPQRVAS